MDIPSFFRGLELLPMETLLVIRPITPFNKPIAPRCSAWYPPMSQSQLVGHPFKGGDALGMGGIGHREHHGIIGHDEMKWRQARHRLGENPRNHRARLGRMDFGVFHPCPQVNRTDFVFTSPLSLNRG